MPRPEENSAIPFMLLIFLFVNVALVVVGWHIRQARRAEYGGGGLDLTAPASTPKSALARPLGEGAPSAPEVRTEPAPAPPAPMTLSGAPPSVVPEALGPAKPAPAAAPTPPRVAVREPALRAAEKAYYALKASPRFKDSRALAAWKKEFLSRPALAALDARYAKDRDLVGFLQGLARSKDFHEMLDRHLRGADVQAFAKALFVKPEVASVARALSDDAPIARTLGRLGMPASLGTPEENAALRKTSESLRRSKENAALKGMLEDAGAPALDDRRK